MDDRYNLEEEVILIGTWLRGEHLEDIKRLDSGMFHYRNVVYLLSKGYDAIKISQETGIKLSELMDMTCSASPVFYAMTLRSWCNKKLQRELREFNISEEGIDKLKEMISNQNSILTQVDSDENITDAYINDLSERRKAEKVLWSKLPSLNRLTSGIRRKQLTTIAGRPSEGKSALALQVLLGIAEQGHKVLYFPLEMSDNEMLDRILIHKRLITADESSSGKVSGEKLNAVVDYLRTLEESENLLFYEGVRDIESIEEAIKKEHPFAIVIDQLTQMRSREERFSSIRERFSYMTSNLKAIAMKYNVAVILICQLNRNAQEQKPTLANLKESGSIEEDSDNILLIYKVPTEYIQNPQRYDLYETNPMIIKIAKQRSGVRDREIKVLFRPSAMLFYEEEKYTSY